MYLYIAVTNRAFGASIFRKIANLVEVAVKSQVLTTVQKPLVQFS